ncbi:hypothetical protein FQN55_007171 [Onygenales sp. PD_40]|nr:hypothetical protein FQN55_007171 [Onygenales sp. PD_40]
MYMCLALEAQKQWLTDPVVKPHIHRTGIIFACIEAPGLDADSKARFDGIFRDGYWAGVTKCTWNPLAGWGDASNALRSVIQAAVNIGVIYVQATATKVVFDSTGWSSGIATLEASEICAGKILLCTGAYIPDHPKIQVGDYMVAAASVMCAFRVPEDQRNKFSNRPIIVHPMGEYPAECIPKSGPGFVKCTQERSFTHKVFHKTSKQEISVPPSRVTQQTWSQDVPYGLQDEAKAVRDKLFGNWIDNMEPEEYRMCWDAITPNQD